MPDEYTDATYGDRVAEAYDEWYEASFAEDTVAAVSFLRELAADGPALELGIGTGRLALPLAEAGIDVHGIDASKAMVGKLKSKPGGDRIPITIGSFANFSLETRFRLVYVVFNTFFGLLTQDEQISCFAAVARHLTPDGVFAMQAFVPDVTRFDVHNQRAAADSVGIDEVALRPRLTTRSLNGPTARPRGDSRRKHPYVPGEDPLRVCIRTRSDGPPSRSQAS